MKNIRLFQTRAACREFINSRLITSPAFHAHPFYRGLIDFIVDNRAPIFFEASEECEHAHFTQYFNFILMRRGYANPVIRDLYFIHDFMHMIFDNPLNVREYTFADFCKKTLRNEYVAANDTEVLTYYRLPQLRGETFDHPILYDLVAQKYARQPVVKNLMHIREDIMFDRSYHGLEQCSGSNSVFPFIQRFRANNRAWCTLWYDQFPPMKAANTRRLPLFHYEKALETYRPDASEKKYQCMLLHNINSALQILEVPLYASTPKECQKVLGLLEGKIILRDAAEGFHRQYANSRQRMS